MGRVITIPADSTQAIRSRETDQQPALQELQDIVDGYIEQVPGWRDYMGTPCVVYANEDGKARELPVNARATALWFGKLGVTQTDIAMGRVNDVLCGDVMLVVGLPDDDDET
jgi:deoxyribodipyrimidine photolyase-like uncharacterized protein